LGEVAADLSDVTSSIATLVLDEVKLSILQFAIGCVDYCELSLIKVRRGGAVGDPKRSVPRRQPGELR
jgi:hypothetical protein